MTRANKRPFALTSALILSLFFGFFDSRDGCAHVKMLRGDWNLAEPSMELMAISDEAGRDGLIEALTRYANELEAARSLAFPFAVASIVIGVATAFFALRAFARAPNSRPMLWQLTVAQIAIVLGSYFAMPKLRDATINLHIANSALIPWMKVPNEQQNSEQVRASAYKLMIGIRVLLGGAIVLVLNRRKTRDYYDTDLAPSEPSEPS